MNLMNNAVIQTPRPVNEAVLNYAPGSPEKVALKAALEDLASRKVEIPLVIGGKEIRTGNMGSVVMPHNHQHVLGSYHKAGPAEVQLAIDAAVSAQADWEKFRWEDRAAIFLKAAELLATKYRSRMNACSMLNGGKTVFQAEIDASCELIDFLRFNVHYAQEIYQKQPESSPGVWNYVQHRPLEGFVFAVTPFNFTAIAGNLPTAPAIMGNTVVWKPASSLVYTPWLFMQMLEEAGLPPGVINFVPGSGPDVGDTCLADPNLAGVHFTGSTRVFQQMWKTIGGNIERYKSYPRIVGETGGKDFVFAHASANCEALVAALVRGAYEYQGQKCSAASRAYIPASLWNAVEAGIRAGLARIRMGPPTDFRNFVGAVIDQSAFESITSYIDYARDNEGGEVILGGGYDDSTGYFIEPTVIRASDPHFAYEETLALCDSSSMYALTGAIFSQDRAAASTAMARLEHAAGNFYINDKPTGAVVGQQPFGGGRASGTNDKAGSAANLMRWVSTRTIKETFVPPVDFAYPFMDEE
jgi:1-pyrroline-5-carboxylate dehydrogenase